MISLSDIDLGRGSGNFVIYRTKLYGLLEILTVIWYFMNWIGEYDSTMDAEMHLIFYQDVVKPCLEAREILKRLYHKV